VNELAKRIESELPMIITKEQLMNYFDANFAYNREYNSLSVAKIMKIAEKAGKKIEGKSNLDVNITLKEKEKFMKRRGDVFFRKQINERLQNNRDKIIAAYASGKSTLHLGKQYGCASSAISRFLKKNGIEVRRGKS
jgi:hypothetical protein